MQLYSRIGHIIAYSAQVAKLSKPQSIGCKFSKPQSRISCISHIKSKLSCIKLSRINFQSCKECIKPNCKIFTTACAYRKWIIIARLTWSYVRQNKNLVMKKTCVCIRAPDCLIVSLRGPGGSRLLLGKSKKSIWLNKILVLHIEYRLA